MKTLHLIAFLFLLQFNLIAQNVPPLVNYQGRLSNPDGSPLATGNYQLSFKVYDAATNGNLVWGPQIFDGTASTGHGATIPVVQGYFNTMLGPADINGVSLVGAFNGTNRFIELTVSNNPPIAPRQQVLTTPFAFWAANATAASSASSVAAANIVGTVLLAQLPGNVALLNSNQTFTGVNFFTNYVVFGTPPPFNRSVQFRPAANRVLGIFAANGGGGSVTSGMTIESVNDANSANQPLEFRGSPNVFTTGNVGIGLTNPTNALAVNGLITATAFSGNGAGLTNLNLTGISTYSPLYNEANGYLALTANTSGPYNAANGAQALYSNTSGGENTANGFSALGANTTGAYDAANGYEALGANTSGFGNTANGAGALQHNTIANYNTANGNYALSANTSGNYNTANGAWALISNTNGSYNIAEGYEAGYNIVTGSSNIDIGNMGLATDANIIRIGSGQTQAFIAGDVVIGGTTNALERFEVDGTDTAYSPGCSIRIRNTFDPVGGFVGDGWDALQFGMYNPSSSSVGVIAAGAKRSFFGFDVNGNVGSIANYFGSPSYRNLLDDGNGNMRISGVISGNAGGLTNVNLTGPAAISALGNEANGYQALYSNTNGYKNTANGYQALYSNTSGNSGTANGYQALYSNTTGNNNVANGAIALAANTTGGNNTASGVAALVSNTTGNNNTANGYSALWLNTSGNDNTADGLNALEQNKSGSYNTANGYEALFSNTNGNYNIADGYLAGYNITTGSNNIEIGNVGTTNDNNTIYIGTQGVQTSTSIAGIFGATAANGDQVYITSSGQLGTLTSSARFKRDIKGMSDASEVLLSLHPVTFRYKPEIDPQAIPQFGLVAEEVEKVDPDLVTRDGKGNVYTVRYEAVNAMLLNEFLKEHHQVQEQKDEIHDLQQRLEALEKIVGQKSN